MLKNSVGLDISDNTIEAVELVEERGKIKVSSLVNMKIPDGVVKNGVIEDKKMLAKLVKTALTNAKPRPIEKKKINFAVPEAQVYIHSFELKNYNKETLNQLILEELNSSIPIDKGDLVFSHKIINSTDEGASVLTAATSKTILADWISFFDSIGLDVDILDIEVQALYRGLSVDLPVEEGGIAVLDIGARRSHMAVFVKSKLEYSFSSFTAGNSMDVEISEKAGITEKEAENIKVLEGLNSTNKKVVDALSSEVAQLLRFIKESINYISNKESFAISKIILVGGVSRMKGLLEYLSKNLSIPVSVGAIKIFDKRIPLIYVGAYGLALRSMDHKRYEKELKFDSDIKNSTKTKRKLKMDNPFANFFGIFKKMDKKTRNQIFILLGILVLGAVAIWITLRLKQ